MKTSTNKRGDIVTFDGIEYRMRRDGYFRRCASGNLYPVRWLDIPKPVRNVFVECTR